jgi:NTE family protein
MTLRRGLVLGGGGITGIGWETGLLFGLQELGVDVTTADAVVGTSAGSVVGAQVTTGITLEALFDYQVSRPKPARLASIGPNVLVGFALSMLRARGDLEAFGRLVGQWSVRRAEAGKLPSLEERFEAIRERLPIQEWGPGQRLQVTAVDANTGALRVFDGSDGVSLVDAVAASCAVPGVYPPVPIEGIPYIDGGARSGSNADLLADCDRVLGFTPVDRAIGPMRTAGQLLGSSVPHLIVSPDAESIAAIGKNVLDPARRAASARAGWAQAAVVAPLAQEIWS